MSDEEEFVALNSPAALEHRFSENREDVEMQQIDFDDHKSSYRRSVGERPTYHHGEETFGDVISHPIEQLEAHRKRRQTYLHEMKDWEEEVKQGSHIEE